MTDFKEFRAYITKMNALASVLEMIDWDNETLAPKESFKQTAVMSSALAGLYHQLISAPELVQMIEDLKKQELRADENAILRLVKKEIEHLREIPQEEYEEYNRLTSVAGSIWAEAKRNNEYSGFAKVLEQLIDLSKKFCKYRGAAGKKAYDLLLDDYEEGFTQKELDLFFDQLKESIVPLLKDIQTKGRKIDTSFLHQPYSVEKQREFCNWLAKYLGFDFDRGVIAESEHPFTTSFHNKNVRITNHFYEDNPMSAIFSLIHETGHALFEMNIADELTQTPAGTQMSMGIHESQSRFYENLLGRSKEFWIPLYGHLQETFPEQLGQVSLDDFADAINVVSADCIRTEADELTYPLHILVRYEIEKAFITEEIDTEKLPKIWNEKYQQYLGITPPDDTKGILQDIHWAGGSFGYFPSYALGSAFGAQMMAHMREVMDVDSILAAGDINVITRYLTAHIHRFGASKSSREILKDMTGEDFNPKYYVEYLENKYRKLYHI